MDIFSYFIISISFLSGSPQSSFSGIRARSVSQRVQIGKGIFLPFKEKCYSNPDGLQGFLTKSGRAENSPSRRARRDAEQALIRCLEIYLWLCLEIVPIRDYSHKRDCDIIKECFPRQRKPAKISSLDALNALLYIVENGCKWRRLPKEYGDWHMIYVRINR